MSERLVPVPRRAKPWQPNPALLLVSTARAFAAAHWDEVRHAHDEQDEDGHTPRDEDPARAFADDGLDLRNDDFRPLHIRLFNQPLSDLSQQALKRFNAEQTAENAVVPSHTMNDALLQDANRDALRAYHSDALLQRAAFTPDIYEFDDEPAVDELEVPADADVLAEDAQHLSDTADGEYADTEHADSEHPEQQASDDQLSQDEAAHAVPNDASLDGLQAFAADETMGDDTLAEPAVQDASTLAATDAQQADVEQAENDQTENDQANPHQVDLAQAEVEPVDAALADAATDVSTDTTTDAMPPQDAAAEMGEVEIAEAELTEEDVIAPQAMADAEDEMEQAAVDAALQASVTAPVVDGVDPEEVLRREAEQYQLGLAEGERLAREAMAQEIAAQRTVMEGVTQQLHALLQNPQQFFEPLKRLAVHVAEQVALKDMRESTRVIEQVIQRCLDSLDHPAQGMVVIELNPQDKARLLETAPDLIQGMRLEAVETMHPGSARLFANDAIVEDLVEHRLQSLVRGLNLDENAWQAQSRVMRDATEAAEPTDEGAQAQPIQPADSSESDDVHS